ncbi:MAG: DegT/DnrJ/EryC1/StrS family aminotransferase [Terrimicrobiaceae bacterium]|nr:DegT/DnrJ/EryC1/StrS family aminotransferase [Terrimicrobiaceae bacterium]
MFDLTRQHALVKEEVVSRVAGLFESQQFILGPAVGEFELAFRDLLGAGHAVGMSSGTDAQLAILMAMRIGNGDAVLTTPYTFFATAGCIHRTGAEPVFVDVEKGTLNLDPARLEEFLETRCTADADGDLVTPQGNKIRAIIPIHLFGTCCKMDEILAIARRHRLTVIEDAAQAVGAEYRGASGTFHAGAIAEMSYFSFFPTKNLGGAGDGGMAVCRDEEMAARLRLMRNHGMEQRYFHREVGGNFRLDALQAAVLHAKLPHLAAWNAGRRRNAALYHEAFVSKELREFLTPPPPPSPDLENSHIYHQYVIRVRDRDALMAHLQSVGIGCAIYYPVPLHLQECFAYLGYKPGDFPVSETACLESLALPIFPELRPGEIESAVDAIEDFFRIS